MSARTRPPTLTDAIKESFESLPPKSVIGSLKKNVKGKDVCVKGVGFKGVFEEGSRVVGSRLCLYLFKTKAAVQDSEIEAEDSYFDARSSNCAIWGKRNSIKGRDHSLHVDNSKIYADNCVIYGDNNTLYGRHCTSYGNGNTDKGRDNTLNAPLHVANRRIAAQQLAEEQEEEEEEENMEQHLGNVAAVGILNALLGGQQQQPVQGSVFVCPEDMEELDLEDPASVPEDEICKLCFGRYLRTQFVPCNHAVTCTKCAQTFGKRYIPKPEDQTYYDVQLNEVKCIHNPNYAKCPVCRKVVVAVVDTKKAIRS